MAPTVESVFDELPNDLLQNILGRLLWRPDDKLPYKAQQRVRLEAVCKRFQTAVAMSGSLDWDVTWPINSKDCFTRYVLSRSENMASLQRLAIQFWYGTPVMTFLRLVILPALETLEEVRIFYMENEGFEDLSWGDAIFHILSACNQLKTLEVVLWETSPKVSSVVLSLRSALRVSKSLFSLVLYGFSFSNSAELLSFIQRYLPNLKYLEVHCEPEEVCSFEATSLEKVFWWGTDCEGFDTANPARAAGPRSLSMVFNMFNSGDEEMQQSALGTLNHLLSSSSACKHIVQAPGLVQKLVGMLGHGSALTSLLVGEVLGKLSVEDVARKVLGEDRGNLLSLVAFFVDWEEKIGCFYDSRDRVAQMLVGLLARDTTREFLASDPSSVRRLIWYALHKWEIESTTAQHAVKLLAHLSPSAVRIIPGPEVMTWDVTETLYRVLNELGRVGMAGLYEGILDGFEHQGWRSEDGVSRAAVAVWQLISRDSNKKRFADSPGCLERLVRLVDVGSGERKVYALLFLEALAEDKDVAACITEMDGSLEHLIGSLHAEGVHAAEIKILAARVLKNIALDERQRERLAGMPGLERVLKDVDQEAMEKVEKGEGGPGEFAREGGRSRRRLERAGAKAAGADRPLEST